MMDIMNVEAIMSPHVVTVSPTTTIGHARELLREREFHHLIVADRQHVVGVLSLMDLGKAADDHFVVEVMRREPASVTPSATIREAAALMNGNGVGCVPVIADGTLCGIVTTADLRRAMTV
jgi:CBS domain-containing protein